MGEDAGEQLTVAALQARVRELEGAIQARDDLLAVAAHELRNPMHALLLQVSAALGVARRHGNPDLVRRIDRVKHIVDRYVKRATVLLDVCRINARQFPLNVESVDLAEIVREVVESYSPEAAFHNAVVTLVAPERLDVQGDRLALEQIVSNLLSNAIKYGASGPVTVFLATEEPDSVRLVVEDRGIGIAMEDQERIFGRFEQAGAPLERRGGFGVGLWLVRSLLGVHGGRIEVTSAPGQGATFVARLPRDATPFQPSDP